MNYRFAVRLSFLLACALPSAHAATLVYTNDVMGELEPCGCRSNPQGGIARKEVLLQSLRDRSLLQLDAGDSIFETTMVPAALQKRTEIQAAYLIKALDMTHLDAMTPGEKEFALGVPKFEALIKNSKIKFLAANLKRKNGSKFLEPSALFLLNQGKKKLRVAVIGIVGKNLPWPTELVASPPVAAAHEQVSAWRKKADLVIILSHQGYEDDVALAKAVKGIDLIVGAHSQSFLQTPVNVNGTLIVQSSFRNQYVGVLPLSAPLSAAGHQLVGLDATYNQKNPQAPMQKLVNEFNKISGQMENKADQVNQATSFGAPKFQTFPRCAECHMKQFNAWRKTAHANSLQSLVAKKQQKNPACLSCHTLGFNDKEGFRNPNVLAETQKPGDLEKTEVFPTDQLSYYFNNLHNATDLETKIKVTPKDPTPQPLKNTLSRVSKSWAPVQCENCHPAGGDHPMGGGRYHKQVQIGVCLKCHTAQWSPKWYTKDKKPDGQTILKKRTSITCPAGE